jgi:hypothetical protein
MVWGRRCQHYHSCLLITDIACHQREMTAYMPSPGSGQVMPCDHLHQVISNDCQVRHHCRTTWERELTWVYVLQMTSGRPSLFEGGTGKAYPEVVPSVDLGVNHQWVHPGAGCIARP